MRRHKSNGLEIFVGIIVLCFFLGTILTKLFSHKPKKVLDLNKEECERAASLDLDNLTQEQMNEEPLW